MSQELRCQTGTSIHQEIITSDTLTDLYSVRNLFRIQIIPLNRLISCRSDSMHGAVADRHCSVCNRCPHEHIGKNPLKTVLGGTRTLQICSSTLVGSSIRSSPFRHGPRVKSRSWLPVGSQPPAAFQAGGWAGARRCCFLRLPSGCPLWSSGSQPAVRRGESNTTGIQKNRVPPPL